MFDLRSLEHSTIIYEPSEKQDSSKNRMYPKIFLESQPDSPSLASLSPPQGPEPATSPTRNTSSLSYPPPLLRIAASPHDAHLLATFSQDSSTIRVLDVRQPGQALLELKGHAGPVNCIEWSNTQRGLLSSGGDDCCVLLWDLMSASTNTPAVPVPGAAAGAAGQAAVGPGQDRGPSAVWECGFEVGNLSWAPSMGALGVCGGRGFWGVQL